MGVLTSKTFAAAVRGVTFLIVCPCFKVDLRWVSAKSEVTWIATRSYHMGDIMVVNEYLTVITVNLSMVSSVYLYWPMLPSAMPKPLEKQGLVMLMFPLREMLSSPLYTVQLLKLMCED